MFQLGDYLHRGDYEKSSETTGTFRSVQALELLASPRVVMVVTVVVEVIMVVVVMVVMMVVGGGGGGGGGGGSNAGQRLNLLWRKDKIATGK